MAPAMNCEMWAHPAVQRNIETLKSWGIRMVGPEEGELACGVSGVGRMSEPEAIANAVCAAVPPQRLSGQRWLVTAGPTYERIDSVRFIGNYSSGKMGFALAEALAKEGAEVELVTGPTHLNVSTYQRINLHRVESAREMYAAATEVFPHCNGAILSAAVADYRPAECADHKLKKNGSEGMHLELVQNPDILATLGGMKTAAQTLVGFALETDNEEANAQRKLEKKNLDYIVLNSLRDKGAGFGVDTNKVTIIGRDGSHKESPLMSKQEVAHLIINTVTS
jgi:phosphopantothenoylcysteine decarboxylase/phosphopantothenate--cysteine ligase